MTRRKHVLYWTKPLRLVFTHFAQFQGTVTSSNRWHWQRREMLGTYCMRHVAA
jgi:hypothetical protein